MVMDSLALFLIRPLFRQGFHRFRQRYSLLGIADLTEKSVWFHKIEVSMNEIIRFLVNPI